MKRVVDGVPKQLLGGSRRLVRLFAHLPEEQPERGTAPSELGRMRERQVKLQAVRDQEHAVGDGFAGKVEQRDRPKLTNEGLGPGFQHLNHRNVVCDGEHEVEV
jgi:hypothetical protein